MSLENRHVLSTPQSEGGTQEDLAAFLADPRARDTFNDSKDRSYLIIFCSDGQVTFSERTEHNSPLQTLSLKKFRARFAGRITSVKRNNQNS